MSLHLYKPLCIPDPNEGYRFLDPANIICVESAGNYSNIYCTKKIAHLNVSMKLSEIADQLPVPIFYRIHRGYLVSRLHIVTMNKLKTRLHCADGIVIRISDTYRKGFLTPFNL